MKPTWILIADGSRARLFEQSQAHERWRELRDWVHPATRLRTESLAFDQLGRASKGQPGATSYVPRTTPRQREHRRFAQALARCLDLGVRSGQCDALVLIASATLLGEIRQALPAQASKRVRWSAPVDLTAYSGRELQSRVEALQPARLPSAPGALPVSDASAFSASPGPWVWPPLPTLSSLPELAPQRPGEARSGPLGPLS